MVWGRLSEILQAGTFWVCCVAQQEEEKCFKRAKREVALFLEGWRNQCEKKKAAPLSVVPFSVSLP